MALAAATRSLGYFYVKYCLRGFSSDFSRKCNYSSSLFFRGRESKYGISDRFYSNDSLLPGVDPSALPKEKRRKTVEIPQIELIDEFGNSKRSSLEAAERISRSKNLKLEQVKAARDNHRAVYKLMTISQIVNNSSQKVEKSSTLKRTKVIIISSKISEHDLENKIRNATKALSKSHSIQIVISNDAGEQTQAGIIRNIEKGIKEFGTIDKKTGGKNARISIKPLVKESEPADSTTSQKSDEEHQA